MDKDYLALKRASTSRPSGEWDDDDYDVLADGVIVGRIMETAAAPLGTPWMWMLAFGHHEAAASRLRGDARGGNGRIRQELAAGMNKKEPDRGRQSG